ncbi:hypothetical protein DOC35_19520 [Salmonella enterica subsp. enterica]|nr:hypothetical protein [Salmonella enterica subsp. enterica]
MKKLAVIAAALALAGCTVGGGVGIGSGGGLGLGAGLSFPVGGSDTTATKPLDSNAPDCNGEIIKPAAPMYPARAQALRKEADIIVKFDVKANGRPTNYTAEGDEQFYRETWSAVSRSCWMPGTHQEFKIMYRLNGGSRYSQDYML